MDNLLIVGINEQTTNSIINYLTHRYRVYLAKDEKTAVDILEEHSVSVVISDIDIPFRLCLIRFIKKKYPHIKSLVFTDDTRVEQIVEIIKNGAYDYLSKPVNIEEFIYKIKSIYPSSLKFPLPEQLFTEQNTPVLDFKNCILNCEKNILQWAWNKTGGHQLKMAKLLNLPRTTLRNKLLSHNILKDKNSTY